MQQAPESSRWQCRAWHRPPPSPAFFCSSHNLRKPADCRWRALLCLSRWRQLSAGRRSTPNAHSSCLLLPDAAYTWHYPRCCCPLSSGMWSNTPPPFFSKPPYRLLICPSDTLTEQIIGSQGETGVTTNSYQLKEAQLCILALITPQHIWIPILIWNKAVQGRVKGMQPFVFTISFEYSHLFTSSSVSYSQAYQWVSCDNRVTLTKSSKLPCFKLDLRIPTSAVSRRKDVFWERVCFWWRTRLSLLCAEMSLKGSWWQRESTFVKTNYIFIVITYFFYTETTLCLWSGWV